VVHRARIFLCFFWLLFFTGNACVKNLECSGFDSSCNFLLATLLQTNIENTRYRASVNFQPSGGIYEADQFVRLSSNQAVDIRYTVDNSVPSCISTPYTEPIQVSRSGTIIRAIACFGSRASSVGVVNQAYTLKRSVASLSGLSFWYSSQSLVSTEGLIVNSWKDSSQSGFKNDLRGGALYSSDSSRSPTIKLNSQNGKQSVLFNSSNKQFLLSQTIKGANTASFGTFFFIIKKSANSRVGENIASLGSSYLTAGATTAFSGSRAYTFVNTSNQVRISSINNGVSASNSSSFSLNTFQPIVITINNSNIQLSVVNVGAIPTTLAASYVAPSELFVFGSPINFFPNAEYLEGEIYEIMYFDRVLSATEDIPPISCYLKEQYNFNLSDVPCPSN
jgi:hypothetical protein